MRCAHALWHSSQANLSFACLLIRLSVFTDRWISRQVVKSQLCLPANPAGLTQTGLSVFKAMTQQTGTSQKLNNECCTNSQSYTSSVCCIRCIACCACCTCCSVWHCQWHQCWVSEINQSFLTCTDKAGCHLPWFSLACFSYYCRQLHPSMAYDWQAYAATSAPLVFLLHDICFSCIVRTL
jgi:hypothetical protein